MIILRRRYPRFRRYIIGSRSEGGGGEEGSFVLLARYFLFVLTCLVGVVGAFVSKMEKGII